MSGQDKAIIDNNAKYLSTVLKDPTGFAVVSYRVFSSMTNAGFTPEQAMDMTKHMMTMVIGIGGMVE